MTRAERDLVNAVLLAEERAEALPDVIVACVMALRCERHAAAQREAVTAIDEIITRNETPSQTLHLIAGILKELEAAKP